MQSELSSSLPDGHSNWPYRQHSSDAIRTVTHKRHSHQPTAAGRCFRPRRDSAAQSVRTGARLMMIDSDDISVAKRLLVEIPGRLPDGSFDFNRFQLAVGGGC
jgi:hypothetical protein